MIKNERADENIYRILQWRSNLRKRYLMKQKHHFISFSLKMLLSFNLLFNILPDCKLF